MFYRLLLLCLFSLLYLHSEEIDVNFKNLSIDNFIKVTSKLLNKSILVSGTIKGEVDFASSSKMTKRELRSLLEQTIQSQGFKLIESKSVIRIVPQTKILKKRSDLKKSEVELISLKHSDAKENLEVIKSLIEHRTKKDKQYSVVATLNSKSNQIILMGELSQTEELRELLLKLDRPKKQVYVQAQIIELNDNLLKEIGARYGVFAGESSSNALLTFSSNLNNGEAIAFNPTLIGLNPKTVHSAVALGASLSLLRQNYALNIISEPSILCLDNEESMIYVGERVSFKTATTITNGGNINDQFSREDIGLTLRVKPRVLSEERVTLFIHTELEGIKNTTTNEQPDTTKKEVKTTAIVEDAQSVIIGGLIEDKSERIEDAVPGLSDIPLLGEIFKHKSRASVQKSLVLIITPYLIPQGEDLNFIHQRLTNLKALESEYLTRIKKKVPPSNQKDEAIHEKHKALILGSD